MSALSHRQSGFQFRPYFCFAEPYPNGAALAFGSPPAPEDEMESAAEAMRATELEAVRVNDTALDLPPAGIDPSKLTAAQLETMSIDELRGLANALDIPERSKITEKSELIDEILKRM
jgi:hypothetical protein